MVESNEVDLGDDLPPMDIGAAFYAKYTALEILGRGVSSTVRRCVEKVGVLELLLGMFLSESSFLLVIFRENCYLHLVIIPR